jgi:hypothetical protein
MGYFRILAAIPGFFGCSPARAEFPLHDASRLLKKAWQVVRSGRELAAIEAEYRVGVSSMH